LGELDPSERADVEAMLQDSPEGRQAAEETRLTVAWLAQQLHAEKVEHLKLSGTNGPPVATGYPPTPPPDRRTRLQQYALGLVAALFMIAATISLVTISPRKPIALTRPAQINLADNTRSIASAELANKELDAAAI